MVGPGALKPSDGHRIKSRRPLLHSRHSGFIYLDLSFFFLSLSIFAPIVVCVIIKIIIIIKYLATERARLYVFCLVRELKP